MTSLVWINIALALAFVLAWVGIPVWMTFRRPEVAPDHSHARAYLAGKAALAAGTATAETGHRGARERTRPRPAGRRSPARAHMPRQAERPAPARHAA